MKVVGYLIVRADGTMRVIKRFSSIGSDEIAYRVNVTIPEAWGRVNGSIDIAMPEPPEALLTEMPQ